MYKRILASAFLCLLCTPLSGVGVAADTGSNGKTPLMSAARNGDNARVRELIGEGADVNGLNDNGGTPIMYAALSGDPETVSVLLEHDADVDAVASNGWTALMIASVKGHAGVARLLLDYGADPNRGDVYSWTPLMRAVYEHRQEIVELLVAHSGTRVNQRGENGVTALHIAVLQDDAEAVRVLLGGGADPGIQDRSGRTAVDFAKQNNDLRLLRMLRAGLSN